MYGREAFPSNQFGLGDPDSSYQIHNYVSSKYDVHFPVFGKVEYIYRLKSKNMLEKEIIDAYLFKYCTIG